MGSGGKSSQGACLGGGATNCFGAVPEGTAVQIGSQFCPTDGASASSQEMRVEWIGLLEAGGSGLGGLVTNVLGAAATTSPDSRGIRLDRRVRRVAYEFGVCWAEPRRFGARCTVGLGGQGDRSRCRRTAVELSGAARVRVIVVRLVWCGERWVGMGKSEIG